MGFPVGVTLWLWQVLANLGNLQSVGEKVDKLEEILPTGITTDRYAPTALI